VPFGWIGLSKSLVEGPRRWVAAASMTALLAGGISDAVHAFGTELSDSVGTFDADQVAGLRASCQGASIAYFAPESTRERHVWNSVESGWAALSECRFIRLNRRNDESEGLQGHFWQRSAQSIYAERHDIPWQNSAPVELGFARES